MVMDSLRYFGSKVWNMYDPCSKNIETFEKFKAEIKKSGHQMSVRAGFVKNVFLWGRIFIYFVNIILVIVFF